MMDGLSAVGGAPVFRWLAKTRLPATLDLRHRGWTLDADASCAGPTPLSVGMVDATERETSQAQCRHDLNACRKTLIVTGVDCGRERAALLREGYGDAVSSDIDLDELDVRAARVATVASSVPRLRFVGDLRLDLLAREAHRGERSLNLNPREFALIWRLAENIDQPVSKQTLIRDVWHMGFVPETNSIAVHMSRLRRKLAFVGIKGLIETVPSGGYALRSSCGAETVEHRPGGPDAPQTHLTSPGR